MRSRLGSARENREIARIALPALGALAAEPLYVLVDTAIVGHLGVSPLAALALAGAVLSGAVNLCNFLAYGSTPKIGRLHAAGEHGESARLGRQALLLAVALGLGLALAALAGAGPLLAALGAHGHIRVLSERYLRIAALGLPFALIAIAGQGWLRGVSRLRAPLVLLLAGNVLNVVLELLFVYALKLGIAGSAWATVIAQAAMAGGFLAVAAKAGPVGEPHARRGHEAWRPDPALLRDLLGTGGEIFVRTGSLYLAFLLAGAILARTGADALAAHQIAFQLWIFLALALDALAIAAQVLVSQSLGRGEAERARRLARRTLGWSLLAGTLFAGVMLALGGVLPRAFSGDAGVIGKAHEVWPIFALMQPLNAVVFALDGILIGAGDTRYLMWAMVGSSALGFAPLAICSLAFGWAS